MSAGGVVLWQGASSLDDGPLAVVAILQSANSKTGPMLQTYIFRSDIAPQEAAHRGLDASACGDCKRRGRVELDTAGLYPLTRNVERDCYVLLWREVATVWDQFRLGRYPQLTHPGSIRALGYCRAIRLGTYGDPAAAPVTLWEALCADARLVLGYTHQWRTRADLKRWCMASVDTLEEAVAAAARGWRYYRVTEPGEALPQLAG